MKICFACDYEYDKSEWNCPKCHSKPFSSDIKYFEEEQHRESYPVEAFEKIFNIEKNHFWFSARNGVIADTIKKYFPSANTFLEIGCGTGYVLLSLSQVFRHLKFYGCDLYSEGLDYAKSRLPNVDLFQMDATKIFFQNEFDIVGAFDILEHIEDDQRVLSEIFKSLKPNGGVIITVPQYQSLWSKTDEYAHHVRRYSRQELTNKLQQAGFEIERITSFVTLLFPALYISRLRYKFLKAGALQQPVEFALPNYLNDIFKMFQRLERSLLQVGINLPFGGSILAVGRKLK